MACAQQGSDWPQHWCSHDVPVELQDILTQARDLLEKETLERFYNKLDEWTAAVQCFDHACLTFISRDNVQGKNATYQNCDQRTCVECKKRSHERECDHTLDEDTQAAISLASKLGASCPKCKRLFDRTEEGCHPVVCPQPCGQNFCILCSQDWDVCKGQCKKGVAEMITKEAEAASPDEINESLDDLQKDISRARKSVVSLKMAETDMRNVEEQMNQYLETINDARKEVLTYTRYESIAEAIEAFLKKLPQPYAAQKRSRSSEDELRDIKRAKTDNTSFETDQQGDADEDDRWGSMED